MRYQSCIYCHSYIDSYTEADFAQIYYKPLEMSLYCCNECLLTYNKEQDDIEQDSDMRPEEKEAWI